MDGQKSLHSLMRRNSPQLFLCIRSLVEMGCWTDLVRYCVYRIEESMDETLFEEMDEDSAVVH